MRSDLFTVVLGPSNGGEALRVENQIAGLGLISLDRVAVGVLGMGSSAVADDVLPAAGVVE